MGISILALVLHVLREEGFAADVAYPGQKYPLITQPVAAVHIEKADTNTQEVTVEVSILCPASMGGVACEENALLISEALTGVGAKCVQTGCVYDSAAQVFTVPVYATFSGTTQSEEGIVGPGFQVYIDNVHQPHATAFSSQKEADHKAIYGIGVTMPEGFTAGPFLNSFQLEEMIPIDQTQPEDHTGVFSIQVETEKTIERFYVCRWVSVRQEYTKEGMRRIRKGIARIREEIKNG